jgi:ribosomal protein S18 acetylase RimI-like enzyme
MNPQTGKGRRPQVTLQHVEREDITEIVQMADKVWRQHFPGIISDEQIDYMLAKMYSPGVISQELESGQAEYYFILNEGRHVGFCSFGPSAQEAEMKLHKLYVLPQYQRNGFGNSTLNCIEQLCRKRKFDTLTLAVNKHNSSAIHAYRSRDFSIEEAVAVDIGGGFIMDDYIMKKRLC